jgi:hypothetical protein
MSFGNELFPLTPVRTRDNSHKSPLNLSRTVAVPITSASQLLVLKVISYDRKEVISKRSGNIVIFLECKVMLVNNNQVQYHLNLLQLNLKSITLQVVKAILTLWPTVIGTKHPTFTERMLHILFSGRNREVYISLNSSAMVDHVATLTMNDYGY